MAFTTRNKKNNQSSTQLITKKTDKNTFATYYDTFTDETKEVNANKSTKQRFELSKQSKRKTRQPQSSLLSPILSPTLTRLARSSPVTPREENKLIPIHTETQSDEATAFSFKPSSVISASSTPSMQKSFSNTARSRTHNRKKRSYKSRPKSAHPNKKHKEKPRIIHKNIVPQLWDNEDQSLSNSLEEDTKESADDTTSGPSTLDIPKITKQRSLSTDLSKFATFKMKYAKKMFPATPEISVSRSNPKQVGFPETDERLKTSREYNKQFILDRIQTQNRTAALFRRRSVLLSDHKGKRTMDIDSVDYQPPDMNNSLTSHITFSIHEEPEPAYVMMKQSTVDYNQIPEKKTSCGSNKSKPNSGKSSIAYNRKQLVYIGGINDRNRCDVRDRLFDLFEMWGDRPDLNISESDESWKNGDCIYVRFPSIAQAVDGVNVFDGIQPNGYVLSAKLVLEGSQMVYIDGLDGDWNEEIFKNFVDVSATDYKVSIKRIIGDKAYAFVQFPGLEAVQSAIDRFDGETEIDGKLVRWVQMVKAYIGKIGENTTIKDIQNELSEFDPSFKYLPVEIRKSREPIYYQPTSFHPKRSRNSTDHTLSNNNNDNINNIEVYSNAPPLLVPSHVTAMTPSSPSMPTIISREQSIEESNSNQLPKMKWRDSLEICNAYYDEEKSAVPMTSSSSPRMISISSPRMELIEDATDDESESDISDMTEDKFEYEWHHYVYVWFWTKYDAMRAQSRFDKRICFGSPTPVRFLLLNDMTQKVYVSGLIEGCCSKESIERDITNEFGDKLQWRKKCIVTYRANGNRPFAYLRFPSIEATKEAMRLFDDKICFGNEIWPLICERKKIHLELVRSSGDLLSHHVSRIWNTARYWYLTLCVLLLPFSLTYQWAVIKYKKTHNINYSNIKELASYDLLQAMFCFSDEWKEYIHHNAYNARCIFVMISYALYFIFYSLILTLIQNIRLNPWEWHTAITALLPIIMYIVIGQLFVCWCSMHFIVVHPVFHVLEHVSMYFEDYILYSIDHIMASDFVALRKWDKIIYPWEYPILIFYNLYIVLASLMYCILYFVPWLYYNYCDNVLWQDLSIQISATILMFCFCYILLCSFNTIISRTVSYWDELHGITELITYRIGYNNNYNFLKLDNEQNLFAWLSLRGFIHRKGDVVFCGLEMNALFLVICVFVNLVSIVIDIFRLIKTHNDLSSFLSNSGAILSQIWFLSICLYFICNTLLIGYWFGKENEYQLNRVEKQKLYLYTERMKQLLNHKKYKLCDNTKISELKILLNSMDALIQHITTNQITPQLWGIKMNDFKWKITMTVIAAVLPSVLVRWMLNTPF